MGMPLPENIDGLSPAELKALVVKLLEKVAELERTIAAQRDEIARLKGGPPRPNIKPSGMEQATDPKPPGSSNERRRRGSTRSKLSIDEERKVKLASPPPGSRFKGYTSFVVQDLVLRPHVVDFRCERWQTADGKVMTAPLPPGINRHFGPQLRRFVLAHYHQGQTTVPRLVTLLRGLGIAISKREVVRLLTADHDGFRDEARDVLRAGLASSPWITVDDTGARHQAKNGFCTQIGNAHFTAFATTASKSRLNFLSLLRAGHDDYVVNDAALAYMRERALAGHVIARLAEHPDRCFADQTAWNAHLEKLGIAVLKVNPDPVLIATEGALWGSVKAHGFLRDSVIVSDDAGQFNVGQHGLCWVQYLESSFIRSKLAIALLLAKRMHFRLWIKLRGNGSEGAERGRWIAPFSGKDEDIRTRFLNASIEHDSSSGRTRRVGEPPSGCFYPECSLGFAKEIRSKTQSTPDKTRLQIMDLILSSR